MSDKTYRISEIFYSIQGEGVRAGTANIFVRFAGCNLKCAIDNEAGFDCDTDFVSGESLTLEQIIQTVKLIANLNKKAEAADCKSVILTGGEPALQIDQPLVDALKQNGYFVAVETNGTRELPAGIDWVCCSPKSAEHTLRVGDCDELKYVRAAGQPIPRPSLNARHYLISPAFEPDGSIKRETLNHCVELVKENPLWKLSLQIHKLLKIR